MESKSSQKERARGAQWHRKKNLCLPWPKGNKAQQMESPLGHRLYYFEHGKRNTTVLLRKKKVFFIFVFCSKWTQQWKNYFQQQQQKSESNRLPIWWQLLINSHIRNPHPTRPGYWEERSKGFGSCFTLFVHCIPHLPSSYIARCFQ